MLKFTTWNANGLKTQKKINKLLSLCNTYDFVCIQETHTNEVSPDKPHEASRPHIPYASKYVRFKPTRSKAKAKRVKSTNHLTTPTNLLSSLPSHLTAVWSHNNNRSCGVAIIYRNNPNLVVTSVSTDTAGRYVSMQVEHSPSAMSFHLLSVYAPADCDTARAQFFASLPLTSTTILMGDFNVVTSPLDRTSPTATTTFTSSVSARTLTNLCTQFDLHDVWRTLHPTDILHSFRRGNFSARLDRVMIPSSLLPLTQSSSILISPQDHSPVTFALNTNTVKMGKDRFFCNTSLFTHAHFRPRLLSQLSQLASIASSRNTSPSERWEWFKTHTLSYLLIQSPIFADQRAKEMAALNAAVAALDARVHTDPKNLELHAERTQTIEALAAHDSYVLMGKALRTQHFRNFVKERVPKHIAKLESHAATSKVIHSLRTSPLSSTSNPVVMLEHARSYWGKVFHAPDYGPYPATSPAAQTRFLARYMKSKLPSHLEELLSNPLTLQEFHDIVPLLPKHRSNGPDGIPYEFY